MKQNYLIYSLGFLFLTLSTSCENEGEKVYKIGFSNCFDRDIWRQSMVNSMKVEASLNPEIDLVVFESNIDSFLQVSNVELMIEEEYDLIIISPLDADLIVPSLEKAYNKGIPVILIDRKANTNLYNSFVGADNYQVGELAAKYILSTSKDESYVVELYVNQNTSVGYERSKGFNKTLNTSPDVNIVKRILAAEQDNHREEIRKTFEENPKIDFFFAFNDALALEAYEISQQVDKSIKTKFIGVDGLNFIGRGIDLVKQKKLAASILYPTGGQESIRAAYQILKGAPVSREIKLNTIIIDSLNANIIGNQLSKIADHVRDIEDQQSKLQGLEDTYISQRNTLRILIGFLISTALLAVYSVFSSKSLRKRKRELEIQNKKIKDQSSQIEKIANEVKLSNEAKVNFFTGLSHEFKTPLTLILTSTQSLSEKKAIKDNKLLDELSLIYKNSKRLLRLINQLLDFRKIEDKKFVLKASKTNLFKFTKGLFKDFEREALRRNIKFELSSNNEDLDVFIDRNLMDIVYFNLLSNAFKFTPNNGAITIDIVDHIKEDIVRIHVVDSGIGIPSDEIENVFKVFFQGSNNNKNSSGIGLHLTKEIIELHRGQIEVRSKRGAEFIVTIKKGITHLDEDELIDETDLVDVESFFIESDNEEETFEVNHPLNDEDYYSVLIIEDNPDLIKYLAGKLSKDYTVHTSDGTKGIELAIELIPDIIICDVNLPDKSGFEICEILKGDLRTSHIPTIILTALDNKDSYIKGLESGADLYLTKPFSLSVLAQSIKTLIYNREKLRYYFVNNVHNISDSSNFGSLDQEFIAEVNKLIETNLDNSEFSVEELASLMNISRIQLYRKIKAIMGINVSDYVQNIRMEKAKNLLSQTKLTIAEVAYAIGFSSPNYFSTSFKAKYNKSPKSFRADLNT